MGFDLDLTLADTRAGIAAAFDVLAERLGVPIDSAAVVSRLGPPLEEELAYWLPAARIADSSSAFCGWASSPASGLWMSMMRMRLAFQGRELTSQWETKFVPPPTGRKINAHTHRQ